MWRCTVPVRFTWEGQMAMPQQRKKWVFAQFLNHHVSILLSSCTSYNPLRGPHSNDNTEPKLSNCSLPTYIPSKRTRTVTDTKNQVNNIPHALSRQRCKGTGHSGRAPPHPIMCSKREPKILSIAGRSVWRECYLPLYEIGPLVELTTVLEGHGIG